MISFALILNTINCLLPSYTPTSSFPTQQSSSLISFLHTFTTLITIHINNSQICSGIKFLYEWPKFQPVNMLFVIMIIKDLSPLSNLTYNMLIIHTLCCTPLISVYSSEHDHKEKCEWGSACSLNIYIYIFHSV